MSKGAQNICFKCDALKRIAARKPKSGLCKEAIGSRILWNTGLFENPDISLRAFFSLKWEAWLVTCTGVYLNVGVRGQRKCLLDRLWGERWTTLHCFHSFLHSFNMCMIDGDLGIWILAWPLTSHVTSLLWHTHLSQTLSRPYYLAPW